MPLKEPLTIAFDTVERFFDRLKLGAKWRFDLWKDLRIQPYAGYGTPECFLLQGRVLDDKAIDHEPGASTWQNVRDLVYRLETDEIPGATVHADFGGRTYTAETGEDGFFAFAFDPGDGYDPRRAWQEVALTLVAPQSGPEPVRATGAVVVPSPDAEFGVISDLDDTVVRTGATDQLKMIRTVMLNNARSRVPFPGVAAFYRALAEGPDGAGRNPIFYVSSSPYNLYDLFEAFLEVHELPRGPIFLKDFGVERGQFLKSGHATHKLERIHALVERYPDLPFVLVGDSGQKDPEIYREAVRRHPGRIRAIYVRNVTPEARDREVEAVADELRAQGVAMILADTTEAAARHAADAGLITPDAVDRVRADRADETRTRDEPAGLKKALDAGQG